MCMLNLMLAHKKRPAFYKTDPFIVKTFETSDLECQRVRQACPQFIRSIDSVFP